MVVRFDFEIIFAVIAPNDLAVCFDALASGGGHCQSGRNTFGGQAAKNVSGGSPAQVWTEYTLNMRRLVSLERTVAGVVWPSWWLGCGIQGNEVDYIAGSPHPYAGFGESTRSDTTKGLIWIAI